MSSFHSSSSDVCVYHEKQYGSMCGQHCLNNLLQGPYFQPMNLANIAAELDKQELAILGGTKLGDEMGFTSSNVDDSGNFSIQVLNVALQQSHDISLVRDNKVLQKALESLEPDVGFVCNQSSHWFAIRFVHDTFWDLNSMNPSPLPISKFFLSAYLSQLKAEGFEIFVTTGKLPKALADPSIGDPGSWFRPGDTQEVAPVTDEIDFQAFSGQGQRLDGGNSFPANAVDAYGTGDADADLQMAIRMSLQEVSKPKAVQLRPEPELSDEGIVRIQVVCPKGKKTRRRFWEDETVGAVFEWVSTIVSSPVNAFKLRGPRGSICETLDSSIDANKLLTESGLVPSCSLTVQML